MNASEIPCFMLERTNLFREELRRYAGDRPCPQHPFKYHNTEVVISAAREVPEITEPDCTSAGAATRTRTGPLPWTTGPSLAVRLARPAPARSSRPAGTAFSAAASSSPADGHHRHRRRSPRSSPSPAGHFSREISPLSHPAPK